MNPPSLETLQERIAGRKWAMDVINDLPVSEDHPFRTAFLDHVKKCFTIEALDPGAMPDQQAKAFGSQVIFFGKYSGGTYDDCPLDYLEWLADQNAALVRYLKSRRIQEERLHED